MKLLRDAVRSAAKLMGYEITRSSRKLSSALPVEFGDKEKALFGFVKNNELSMTSNERMFATMMACKYAVTERVDGDFVECGVWRGGNTILAAGVFKEHNADRGVYLFDTFEGMTEPTEADRTASGKVSAKEKFEQKQDNEDGWCYSSLDEVKNNFAKAGLLSDKVKFVKGDVLKTLADESNLPSKISVLRLDTDWYESTKKELEVLYPRLSVGGVLMIDDYGHWAGAKKAVDEYFEAHGNRPFLQYIDRTGRIGIKMR
jgi:hypothetical protein